MRGDRGSVLILVPAAVLVLLILGAIAVDSAVVLLAQRELANTTAGVANDIAGAGVSDDAFYADGAVRLDQRAADSRVTAAFGIDRMPAGFEAWDGTARVDAGSGAQVTVEAWAQVSYVFAGALPGVRSTTVVRATSVASARQRADAP